VTTGQFTGEITTFVGLRALWWNVDLTHAWALGANAADNAYLDAEVPRCPYPLGEMQYAWERGLRGLSLPEFPVGDPTVEVPRRGRHNLDSCSEPIPVVDLFGESGLPSTVHHRRAEVA
jgi:hypothetical protein